MKRIRLFGLCLVAASALCAVVASAAYAEAPEMGRCVKVTAGTGKFSSSKCTKEKAGGSYEWYAGAEKTGFSGTGGIGTLETVGKIGVQCKTEKSSGQFTGAKTVGSVNVTFTECASAGFQCESAGAGSGVIKTFPLAGELVWESKAKKKVAVKLFAEAGELLAKFVCGPSRVEVRGAVLVNIPAGRMETTFAEKYSSKKGIQKPAAYENAKGEKVPAILETDASSLTKGWEQSGQTITNTQTDEEALEVNNVF